MKLSQTTKDFFDVIRTFGSYISIAAAGFALIGLSINPDIFKFLFAHNYTLKYVGITLGSLFLITPILGPYIYNRINQNILKRRKLSNIIIQNQNIIIDITDNGSLASYYEKISFYRIGKDNFSTMIIVDGTIEDIHSLNCFYNLNNEKNRITVCYVNNSSKLNYYPSIVKGHDKFLIFTAIFKDTFLNKIEKWDIIPIHYCVDYTLQVALPINSKIKSANIYKVSDTGVETRQNDITPIIVTENGRSKIIMQIVDYDYGERIRLKWELF